MTRVSEGSSVHSINYSVGKSKSRLEDLQIKGSNLKRVQKPSDDPVGNTELLAIRSQSIDSKQYLRNASVAKTQLSYTENAIEELTDIMNKAKEIAIGQASNFFDPDIRKSVAREVSQLRKQAISIGNRRLGSKYVFSGHKSLTKPFDGDGKYLGDKNQTKLEVAKDFYVPVNFSGDEIFFEKKMTLFSEKESGIDDPLKTITPTIDQQEDATIEINRTPANDLQAPGMEVNNFNESRTSLFDDLEKLENGLLSNNHEVIQSLLPKIDTNLNKLITIRTKIGSVINSVDSAIDNTEKTTLLNAQYKSKIEDADVAELFTDLTRQQNVLNATYKSSAQMMNNSLMNFIR